MDRERNDAACFDHPRLISSLKCNRKTFFLLQKKIDHFLWTQVALQEIAAKLLGHNSSPEVSA